MALHDISTTYCYFPIDRIILYLVVLLGVAVSSGRVCKVYCQDQLK